MLSSRTLGRVKFCHTAPSDGPFCEANSEAVPVMGVVVWNVMQQLKGAVVKAPNCKNSVSEICRCQPVGRLVSESNDSKPPLVIRLICAWAPVTNRGAAASSRAANRRFMRRHPSGVRSGELAVGIVAIA